MLHVCKSSHRASYTICKKNTFLVIKDFPDTLDCSIPQATDAITPEEREELKVSGLYCFNHLQEHHSFYKVTRSY